MMRFFVIAAFVLASLVFGRNAAASLFPVTDIELIAPEASDERVALPHFIRQDHSRLLTVHWRVRLPPQLLEAELPAMLIPQTVQGARISLHGQLVYQVAASDAQTLRNWYSPTLVPLPKAMLNPKGDNSLEVEQTGHLPGWFIAPMLLGEIKLLQPLFESYNFISQTLTTTVNVLCGFVGLFLIIVGLKSNQQLFVYGGLIAGTWSLLVGTALVSQLPTDLWHLWRLALYFLTGWLIYFEIAFNFAIYRLRMRRLHQFGLLALVNAGWVIFAVAGKSVELFLDSVWTGLVVSVYAFTLIWIIRIAVQRKDWRLIAPIFLFLLFAMVLAFHDYRLQTGLLPINLPYDPQELWRNIALQPIYLAHLALPAFIAMTLWLVGSVHIKITKNQLLHKLQLSQERERIVSDIHDGVGSRINLLLWGLRTEPPQPPQIIHELQNCMDELRFAINPPQSGLATLHDALQTLVQRLSDSATGGLELHYKRLRQSAKPISSDLALHLYKATQECLSNALRHGQATQIEVFLDHSDSAIEVSVLDNGQGIPAWDNAAQQQRRRRPTSLGLVGLQQRMQHRNGTCDIQSSASGTKICLGMSL